MKICSLSANFEQDLKLYRNCQRIRNSLYLRILTSKQKQPWLINHSLLGYLLASRYKFGIPGNSLEVLHNAQSLIKIFLGFFGMYCINDILDLVPVICSSTERCRLGEDIEKNRAVRDFLCFQVYMVGQNQDKLFVTPKNVEASKCF